VAVIVQEPGERCLIGQFGAESCPTQTHGNVAVVEFCAQRGACLARERAWRLLPRMT
jgi:hypothetical protein